MTVSNLSAANKFAFCSSIADDVWHKSDQPNAYEWWYFDAVSDDARDAVVVIFLDNFIFSPRYNAAAAAIKSKGESDNGQPATDNGRRTNQRFPAVAFCFYRDGKPIYRSINEFAPEQFSAGVNVPNCRIGDSDFQFETTPYGVRYLVNINQTLRGNRKLRASLEWLAVESDFMRELCERDPHNSHFWNLAVPRADVTGKIEVFDRSEKRCDQIQFRGTGYHDHNQDNRWLPAAVNTWQWGRAHFADATAVYYRYCESNDADVTTKLFLINNGEFQVLDADFACETRAARRNVFGLKYPASIALNAANNENACLTVGQRRVIDASFFYLRFLSEMRLETADGRVREAVGITEHLAPRALEWRHLDWLVNMRIGRDGRGAFLP